jgi:hypothetical protein
MSSWNASTNQFRVLWARKGMHRCTVETLTSCDQVLLMDNNNNNNDLDGDGDTILNAHVSVDDDSQYGIKRGFRAVHYDLGCGISCCAAPGPEGPLTL